ncbi:MAG: hypothetical protein KKH80_02850 [Candidatus Omnitrophica bacterium]|nr:hypothetical protein [Candidatus Omnitrophota bacterium]
MGAFAILSFISAISSCQHAVKQKNSANQEMLKRMELEEEKMSLLSRNSQLKERAEELKEKLDNQKSECKASEEALKQEIFKLKEDFRQCQEQLLRN